MLQLKCEWLLWLRAAPLSSAWNVSTCFGSNSGQAANSKTAASPAVISGSSCNHHLKASQCINKNRERRNK